MEPESRAQFRALRSRCRPLALTLIRGNTYNSCAVEPIGRRMRRSARPPSARAESTGVFFDTDSGGRLHEYEMIVVMNPEIAEEEVPSAIERVTTAVTSRGGEVVEVQPWGRRKLAYPIGPHTEGNYVLTQIRLDPLRAHELEGNFAISDDIVRHLLIRKDEE